MSNGEQRKVSRQRPKTKQKTLQARHEDFYRKLAREAEARRREEESLPRREGMALRKKRTAESLGLTKNLARQVKKAEKGEGLLVKVMPKGKLGYIIKKAKKLGPLGLAGMLSTYQRSKKEMP